MDIGKLAMVIDAYGSHDKRGNSFVLVAREIRVALDDIERRREGDPDVGMVVELAIDQYRSDRFV